MAQGNYLSNVNCSSQLGCATQDQATNLSWTARPFNKREFRSLENTAWNWVTLGPWLWRYLQIDVDYVRICPSTHTYMHASIMQISDVLVYRHISMEFRSILSLNPTSNFCLRIQWWSFLDDLAVTFLIINLQSQLCLHSPKYLPLL